MNILPLSLEKAIQTLLNTSSPKQLSQARKSLTSQYREQKGSPILSKEHCLSYLATRLPATFHVARTVFQELQARLPKAAPKSLLDLGAGPGTVYLALTQVFDSVEIATLIELNSHFMEMGNALIEDTGPIQWQKASISPPFPSHDIVTLSYVLSELPEKNRLNLLEQAWEAANQFLILIEPGTPHGFSHIKTCRQHLIGKGAFVVAPCTHENTCPMSPSDWCHFSVRLKRPPFHRAIKEATLDYEDEKYSYLILSKAPIHQTSSARLTKSPKKRRGHVIIELCTSTGLENLTITKREKSLYKFARKAKWGSYYSPDHL
ncbi:MAG: hypothetical protein HOI80_04210 [Alphaproteobacteria bacterium]|jgi:ribosomal protein RSM22 (predicted rRNA methylase)|nr:hypothetical protein [Alphaproteobacteria bacterium]MBT5389114.1 hypothetical protein [Alphaproteobacteria bacterium]MBT5541049.1 hypothetical protein [Alphaproteobacteria bacterium]MBT5654688.1 hypothetical protein [Alphaproteobacteria bacterium]